MLSFQKSDEDEANGFKCLKDIKIDCPAAGGDPGGPPGSGSPPPGVVMRSTGGASVDSIPGIWDAILGKWKTWTRKKQKWKNRLG